MSSHRSLGLHSKPSLRSQILCTGLICLPVTYLIVDETTSIVLSFTGDIFKNAARHGHQHPIPLPDQLPALSNRSMTIYHFSYHRFRNTIIYTPGAQARLCLTFCRSMPASRYNEGTPFSTILRRCIMAVTIDRVVPAAHFPLVLTYSPRATKGK